MQKLLIITTGGTIDKVYFDANSEYEVGPPVAEKIVADMKVAYEIQCIEVCRKDSLEISDEDRLAIQKALDSSEIDKVLITHGTDTMVETAEYLRNPNEKVIVLTGAMQPAIFKETDGIFNIGTALGILSSAKTGVYIAMSGRSFTPDSVVKNYETMRFENKD